MKHPVATLERVSVEYSVGDSSVAALQDVSLAIHPGSSLAILGRSGSGKSTLVALLSLLRRPTRGVVTVDGRAIAGLRDHELSRLRARYVGTVFQSFHLDQGFTAVDNVTLPWSFSGARGSRRQARERGRALLDAVGIGDLAERLPGQMSGGQRQRVAIARALFSEPALLIADEPTGNLDEDTASEVADCLFALPASTGTAVVVVTHDEEVASRAASRLRLVHGRVADQDSAEESP